MGKRYQLRDRKTGAGATLPTLGGAAGVCPETGGAAGGCPSLSFADNSTSLDKALKTKANPWRARSKAALAWNVQRMAESNPSGAAFLTLTVGDWKDGKFHGVSSIDEVSRRWNSLRRHIESWLSIKAWVAVPERHANGNWHFHVFLSSGRDFRRGYDWALSRATGGRRSGACPALRGAWDTLRRKLPAYGFGRHQLEPVRTVKACGKYLGKYLGKGMEGGEGVEQGADLPERFQDPSPFVNRRAKTISCMGPVFLEIGETKAPNRRIRLVRYGGDWNARMYARGWSWATTGGRVHRMAIATIAKAWGLTSAHDWQAYMRRFLGAQWCAVLWGWWTMAKKRGWGVVWALRRAEFEGIIPPDASKKTSVLAQAWALWKGAELQQGRLPRGFQTFRTGWLDDELTEW